MYQSVSFYDFERAFVNADRSDSFSYLGKRALFEYLEDLEGDIGEMIELDVIALCCDYTEWASLEELQGEYGGIDTMDALEEQTIVIDVNGAGFITENF